MMIQKRQQQRVRLALVAILGLVGSVPSLFGASIAVNPCVKASLATYTAEGFECTLDQHTLIGFTFSASGGASGPALLSASQITVDPTATTPTDISLQFSAPDIGFTAGEGQTAQYIFHWNEDQFFDIGGADMDLFDAPGTAALTGEFCGNGTIVSAPNPDPTAPVFCNGSDTAGIFPHSAFLQIPPNPNGVPSSFMFPTLVGTLDSDLILDLTGPANISSFGLHTVVTGASPTPEPSTLLFLTPALLALAWFRKKRA